MSDSHQDLGDIKQPHMAVHMSGNDDLYGSDSEEVILKKIDSQKDMITSSDLQAVIDGWEERFEKLTEGMRTIERSTYEVHAHMDIVLKDNRARENGQLATNKQIKLIQEGLARFIETCDPAHPTPLRTLVQPCAPKMSTPITPSGAPTSYRSDLSFASPVNQTTPVQPTRGDGGRNLNQQPTHEDGNRNGNDIQQPTMNENYTGSGLNNTTTRHLSSPKVPIFDGTVSAQFRPWLIQFEAIARHQCWTSGEKVVCLVASNWNDHGPIGRLYIPSFPLITQIRPTRTRRGPSSRTTCAHQASKRIRRRLHRKHEKSGATRILKRRSEHAGQPSGRAVQRRT